MKKIIYTLIIFMLIIVCCNASKVYAEEGDYIADLANGLPSDWSAYGKADVNNGNWVPTAGGGITISHENASITQEKYYGYLLEIGGNLNYTDFTLEMEFEALEWANDTRWFGIGFHTQKDAKDMLSGYMMIYRISGKTEENTFNTTPEFTASIVTSTGVPISDSQSHVAKIVCQGTNVDYYIDNILFTSFDYTEYSSQLSDVQHNGGFCLVVNRMSMNVKSFKISPNALAADSSVADVYDPENNLVGEIAALTKVNSLSDLTKFKSTDVTPTTAILNIDENMNVVDSEGNSLGLLLHEAYNNYLKGKIIPGVYIKDLLTAQNFIKYYFESFNILDMVIISDDPELVKLVRSSCNRIRGAVDWSNKDIKEEDLLNVVGQTNASYAQTVILSPETATYSNMRFIQARFKTVWVDNVGTVNEFQLIEQITNGAYGIICDDYEEVYYAAYYFDDEELNYFNRMSFNVAHRGQSIGCTEQTIYGCMSAYEQSATHIEFDIYLTKDEEIVIMHDSTIDRTTDGTGKVSELTLAEIQQWQVKYNCEGTLMPEYMWETVPSLAEFFAAFKDIKDVILLIEIKSGEEQLIYKLRDLIREYNIADHCVVSTFNVTQLARMKEVLPEVPTGHYTNFKGVEQTLSSVLLTCTSLNCMPNKCTSDFDAEFARQLNLRGYASWYWTYHLEKDFRQGLSTGTYGATNNSPEKFYDYGMRIELENRIITSDINDVNAKVYTYGREYVDSDVEVFYDNFNGKYGYAIYTTTYDMNGYEYQIYSDKVLVLSNDFYMTVDEINGYLNKDASDLNKEDVSTLKQIKELYQFLTENEKAEVNIAKADQLISEYRNLSNSNNDGNEPSDIAPSNTGCGGNLSISILSLVILLIVMFLVRMNLFSKKEKSLNGKLLTFVLLFALCFVSLEFSAVNTVSAEEIANNDGLSFTANDKYVTASYLQNMPQTFEGYITLPQNRNQRLGIILSNYGLGAKMPCYTFEIHYKSNVAVPKLYYDVDSTLAGLDVQSVSLEFYDVDFTDKTLYPDDASYHLVITHDPINRIAKCYVNGEVKQTIEYAEDGTYTYNGGVSRVIPENSSSQLAEYYGDFSYVPTISSQIGGDYRSGNAQYFKGTIKACEFYSDVRTDVEIAADYNRVITNESDNNSTTLLAASSNTDTMLLASYDFTQQEKPLHDLSMYANHLSSTNGFASDDMLGASFTDATKRYELVSPLAAVPHTFEAVIYIPAEFTGRSGVILSNYGISGSKNICFEIRDKVALGLWYTKSDGSSGQYSTSIASYTGSWIHVAVVLDEDSDKISFYVNGKKINSQTCLDFADGVIDNSLCLGGDYRSGNAQNFKHYVRSVTLYSDTRSDSEILSDSLGYFNTNDTELLLRYQLDPNTNLNETVDLSNNGYDVVLHDESIVVKHDGNGHWSGCAGCNLSDGELVPHTLGSLVEEQSATCTSEGLSKHYRCTGCDAYFDSEGNYTSKESLVISKVSHTYGTYIKEQPATCTTDGTKGYYHCSSCEKNYDSNNIEITDLTIKALGHKYSVWVEATEPTCEKDGYVGHYECGNCDLYFDENYIEIEQANIVSKGHNYEYTFYDYYYHWHSCICGAVDIQNQEPHDFGEGVILKEPSFDETGRILYECSSCGCKKVKVINKLIPPAEELPEEEVEELPNNPDYNEENNSNSSEVSGGCAGSILSSSSIIILLLSIAYIFSKSKKNKEIEGVEN